MQEPYTRPAVIDARRLLIFEAVARAGSFSGAAAAVHISQPSVSRHVAALEAQCGVRLLNRTRGGVRPTPAGAALIDRAAAVRAELAAADATAAAFAQGEAGEIRVAAFPTAAAALVAPAFSRLRRTHPGISASLREAPRVRALELLRDGDTDVAIIFDAVGDGGADPQRLVRETVLVERFLLALPRSHPCARRGAVSLSRLRDDGWIIGTASDGPGAIERACRAAGFSPRVVAAADDQPTIQALVEGGVGVTLIPELAARNAHKQIALRPTKPALSRRVSTVTLAVEPTPCAVTAFKRELELIAQRLA